MIIGYDQVLKASGNVGGAKVVFEGKPELLIGGFDFDLKDLPGAGVVLPCGTPVYCDEANRTISPLITLKVLSIDAEDAKKIKLYDNGFNGPAVKVGDKLAVINDTITTKYQNTAADGSTPASYNFVSVAAVDGVDVTLENPLASLSADDILVVVVEDETTHKAAIKGAPNALLPYDIVYDAAATAVHGDGMWSNDRPVLERRMPPITAAIKTALADAGCQFKYSDRK